MKQELKLTIQDIKIRVSTNNLAYYNYLRLHFSKVIVAEYDGGCDLEINAGWKSDFWGKNPPRLETSEGMSAIGANTFLGDGHIATLRKIGRKRKVWLSYTLEKGKLRLNAFSHIKTFKDSLRYNILKQPQESYFFELTYPLIYYPLFWYIEYFKNIHVMHASAVSISNKCVLICGLEGIGKTSLSLSLAKEKGSYLFSDNLIFYDKEKVYPCYEPIRINRNDDKSVWEYGFKKINEFRTLKDFYEPLFFNRALNGKPSIIIIPCFNRTFFIRESSAAIFANRIMNINQLTAELGNYNEYASVMNMLVPEFNIWDKRREALSHILDSARCYEIGMPKTDGLANNLARVKEFIKGAKVNE
jgi:hypothetical protein